MRKFILLLLLFPGVVCANNLTLDDALRATYTACVGIDDELADLKQMAGINTAITAVGTAAGAGATAVGLVKANKDKDIRDLEELLARLEKQAEVTPPMTLEEIDALMQELDAGLDYTNLQDKSTELNNQSKKLGNWRTGLMAGATATNLAGAIIAGTNQVRGDLATQINACKDSIKNLRNAMMQARMDGVDISEAQTIVDACGDFEYSDLSKINTRGRGAAISSGVGAATGLAGTITSAMANSNEVRNATDADAEVHEKNLNTASNILAGTTTVASATATVFNATQIKAIKQVADVASKCTGVLK